MDSSKTIKECDGQLTDPWLRHSEEQARQTQTREKNDVENNRTQQQQTERPQLADKINAICAGRSVEFGQLCQGLILAQ